MERTGLRSDSRWYFFLLNNWKKIKQKAVRCGILMDRNKNGSGDALCLEIIQRQYR